MILEKFIEFLEDQIRMSYQIPSPILGRKIMQDVLVQDTPDFNDPSVMTWMAVSWPTQRISVNGKASREEAISDFIPAWNARMRQNLVESDFRFFGPLIVTAYLRELSNGWECAAYAETTYMTDGHSTEDEAKIAFIAMWNETHPDAEDVADINIDWQYDSAPE